METIKQWWWAPLVVLAVTFNPASQAGRERTDAVLLPFLAMRHAPQLDSAFDEQVSRAMALAETKSARAQACAQRVQSKMDRLRQRADRMRLTHDRLRLVKTQQFSDWLPGDAYVVQIVDSNAPDSSDAEQP
jgi:hypothetical protein